MRKISNEGRIEISASVPQKRRTQGNGETESDAYQYSYSQFHNEGQSTVDQEYNTNLDSLNGQEDVEGNDMDIPGGFC